MIRIFVWPLFAILVLSVAPGDEDAIRCKVVALIKNDSIDDALSAIELLSKKSAVDFSFFKVLLIILDQQIYSGLSFEFQLLIPYVN